MVTASNVGSSHILPAMGLVVFVGVGAVVVVVVVVVVVGSIVLLIQSELRLAATILFLNIYKNAQ